ncbi:transporter [Salmonella enterica subsp. enterica]|uniref:Transporter n=1 Tax=Salmonella enterica I TaxID=59201 RepID=A0A379WA07_SALET|nr:transporter [Salmonella enterica subsp. enterica]
MSEFFPKSKAKVTSILYDDGGVANFIIPLITGYLSTIGLQYIILLDFAFALLTFITALLYLFAIIAYLRSRKTMSDLASVIPVKMLTMRNRHAPCSALSTY